MQHLAAKAIEDREADIGAVPVDFPGVTGVWMPNMATGKF